jgi:aspartate-semialdehyde dehydrogenase
VSGRQGRRIGVVGATGVLGSDLIELLEERRFPVSELRPIATDRALGEMVELGGEEVSVQAGEVSLRGLDFVFLCVPANAAGDWVRRALRDEVPCVDLSGSLSGRADVPTLAAELGAPREQVLRPLVSGPPSAALACALALAPLQREARLTRVVGTHLEPASSAGRDGIRTLEAEVVALFNHEDVPESDVFALPVAFDCLPELGGTNQGDVLGELLGGSIPTALTTVQVPTFSGLGVSLAVEMEREVAPEQLREWWVKAPGIEVWDPDLPGPTTRDAASRDVVLAGRIRPDTSRPGGLLLWLTADPVRLAASNAVRLAELRFDVH